MRRCDPWSVCYKTDSQAWGYRMRLLSSIFPNIALATKVPLRFNNLDIGGGFPCYKTPLRFQQLHPTRTYPFIFKDCTFKGTSLLQNATLVSTISIKIHDHQASSFIVHYSSQINTDHASSCLRCFSKLRFGPYSFATKCPFDLISQHEAHHVMLQNATAIFMMG